MSTEQDTQFAETLHVPLRWWVQATMFVASIWLAFVVALPSSVAWGATGVLVVVVTALFVGYGAARLRVEDGSFHAGQATIPVRCSPTRSHSTPPARTGWPVSTRMPAPTSSCGPTSNAR